MHGSFQSLPHVRTRKRSEEEVMVQILADINRATRCPVSVSRRRAPSFIRNSCGQGFDCGTDAEQKTGQDGEHHPFQDHGNPALEQVNSQKEAERLNLEDLMDVQRKRILGKDKKHKSSGQMYHA